MNITKILKAIESDSEIKKLVNQRTNKSDWTEYTRTIFNLVAKQINSKVTQCISNNPYLFHDNLLIGAHKIDMLLSDFRLISKEELFDHLVSSENNKPFIWISGKTLQSYWSGGSPKDLKINVLLTYLGIDVRNWDDWKYNYDADSQKQDNNYFHFNLHETVKGRFLRNISNYYLGSYYLYYLKSDKQRKVVKAPFVIFENENGEIIIKTTTEGQRYLSYPAQKMGNALCVMGKNLDWEEIHEMHLFNIGLETNPKVIFGVSVTMTIYGGFPVALKNILIKQSKDTHLLDDVTEKDISLDIIHDNKEERLVVNYFNTNETQIMFAEYGTSFDGFEEGMMPDSN